MATPSPVTSRDFAAVLFDLDGVLTTTRAVHAAAWSRAFDDFLPAWDAEQGTTSAPFDPIRDYAANVDDKARQDGSGKPYGRAGSPAVGDR